MIPDEGLQANARDVGDHLARPRSLAHHRADRRDPRPWPYLGVDLVRDPVAKTPASHEAHVISERMRELGVIVQPTGDHGNVLKVKPPCA